MPQGVPVILMEPLGASYITGLRVAAYAHHSSGACAMSIKSM